MALRVIRRGKISNDQIMSILDGVYRGKINKSAAASALNLNSDQFDKLYKIRLDDIKNAEKSLSVESSTPSKLPKRVVGDDEYDSDVQKIISYKGVIRPLTLNVQNKHGGTYKLRVINIYVKPNYRKFVTDRKTGQTHEIDKENTRYYEEKVYSVNKGAIVKGSSSDYYYPDKALWSKHKKKQPTLQPKKSVSETPKKPSVKLPDIIELRRKRKSAIIKRHTVRKAIRSKIRRTIKKR